MESYTLLLVTDYSETAQNAERYAIEFAKNTHSSIRVMHAFPPIGANEEGIRELEKTDYNPAFLELSKLKSHFQKKLNSLRVKAGELNFECVVREGSASQQIMAEAREVPHDFIIMGTHGASGLKKFFLGSHTWDVIKKCGTPVLAIPPEAKFSQPKEIVFATEYREGELPVLNFLTQIAARLQSRLTVLHLNSAIVSEKKLEDDFKNELKNKIVFPNISIRKILSDDVIAGIDSFCKNTHTDLLVMSHQKTNFFEKLFHPSVSITKQMSFHTRIPLLSIPDYYNPDYEWFWKLFALDYSAGVDS